MCKPFLLLVSLFVYVALPTLADEPIDVAHRLTDAIRGGDKAVIAPFYATLKSAPLAPSWIDSLVASPDSDFNSPIWCFDSKTNHDAAVVIVGSLKRRNLDLDPCYMIRVPGRWRVLPKHTDIEIARGSVPEATMKALEQLAAWYKSRKNALLDELGKELEASWKKPAQPTQEEARKLLVELFSRRDPKGHPAPRTPPRPSSEFTASELVGRWRHVDAARKLVTNLTFKNDGTYVGSVEVDGRATGNFSGKWTLKVGRLNYEYTASSDKNIPAGTKDQDQVVELTRGYFTIENSLGIHEMYIRIE